MSNANIRAVIHRIKDTYEFYHDREGALKLALETLEKVAPCRQQCADNDEGAGPVGND